LLDGLLEGFLLGTLVGAGVVTNAIVVKVTVAVAVSFNFVSVTAFASVALISPASIASAVSALSSLVKEPSTKVSVILAMTLSSSSVVDVLSVGHSPGLQNSLRKILNTTCRKRLLPAPT
jgi:hypothetical protein